MQTEIFDDFIPYWDDSTESDYDYQDEPIRLKKKKVFDFSKDDEELPF